MNKNGYIMRATIKADDGRDIPIMSMGPISIIPELKRRGYGKILLDYSLEKRQISAAVPYALRAISISMEKADSRLQKILVFVDTASRTAFLTKQVNGAVCCEERTALVCCYRGRR